MKHYYVAWGGHWFVVKCDNKKQARSQGLKEFSTGMGLDVREATPDEVASFRAQRGERAMEYND